MPRGTVGPSNDPNSPKQGIDDAGSGDWHLHQSQNANEYVIVFDAPFPSRPTVVATCHVETGQSQAIATVFDVSQAGFSVKLVDHAGSGGQWRFEFVAMI